MKIIWLICDFFTLKTVVYVIGFLKIYGVEFPYRFLGVDSFQVGVGFFCFLVRVCSLVYSLYALWLFAFVNIFAYLSKKKI